MSGKFDFRKWQKDARDTITANARLGQKRALICACPGAGKTIGGLLIAQSLISSIRRTETVIVITPNLAIKSQWMARAKMFGFNLVEVKDARRLLDDMLPLGVSGYIMSYQQAVQNQNALRLFSRKFAPIVILDEVHHTAGMSEARSGNAWGVAIEDAFREASFVLCTTGTPFRQGNNPIVFIEYNDEGKAVASFSYPLAAAIRDGVCRPTSFRFFDGAIEWTTRAGAEVRHSFEDELPKKLRSERLEAALSMDGDFPIRMLEEADAKLTEIRSGSGVDANAGGLVVAIDTDHADALAAALARISGETPTIVHSKIDEAHDRIREFEASRRKWIVGVSMLSEGVDIPRLRVGVYATRIRAPLYFHQFCGRFYRVQESREERSFVYMPNDTELVAIAREIEEERYHALGEEPDSETTRVRVGGKARKQRDLEVEESTSVAVLEAFGGDVFSIAEIEAARPRIRMFREINPNLRHLADAEVMKIFRGFSTYGGEAA